MTNTGAEVAQRVSLEVRVPNSVRVVTASPEPIEKQAFLGWKFEELGAGETTKVQIIFVASEAGPLNLSAHVRHTSSQQESFIVAQPLLEVALSGPQEVRIGEPASQTVLVKNPGSGVATNVKLQAMIPQGLEHAEGEHLLMEIGSLNPGEVRSVRLVMGAVGGGDHVLQVQANADSGLVKTAAAEVTVIAPSLKAGIDGPSLRYLGREAEFVIRVLNDGMAATDFVQVTHRVPEGFEFVSAERGVKFDPATRLINWYVGALESNQSQDLKVRLVAHRAGEFVHDVRATSEHGTQANAPVGHTGRRDRVARPQSGGPGRSGGGRVGSCIRDHHHQRRNGIRPPCRADLRDSVGIVAHGGSWAVRPSRAAVDDWLPAHRRVARRQVADLPGPREGRRSRRSTIPLSAEQPVALAAPVHRGTDKVLQ